MHLLVRLVLRIASLALKFALTIIVARTLGFTAVADYGLALAISVVSSKVLGLGFSTEINRRLSSANPAEALRDARGLLFLYGIVYAVIAVVVMIAYHSAVFDILGRLSLGVLWGVMLVAFSEHAGLETVSYVFSLHRQRAGAFLLFVRTGAWAAVAIIGLLSGVVHSIETIFALWYGTNLFAVFAACWCLSRRSREVGLAARGEARGRAGSFRSVWIEGLPFFFAAIVLSGLQYGERFLASYVLSAETLGRYVFAWSISNSIQTIAYATIVVTAGPRLVRALCAGGGDYRDILRRSLLSSFFITLLCAAAILIVQKPIFRIAHEAAGSHEFSILVILLVSFILRSIADVLWVSAVALRLGKPVAVAMLCVASVILPIEWMLIDRLGEVGAALAHLSASLGVGAILAFIVARAGAIKSTPTEKRGAIHAAEIR
jgi:O-antigen/teichoic acid export membrane protein